MSLTQEVGKSGVVERSATAPPAGAAKMDPLALVFLDNPIARRLVVAWQTCAGDEDSWQAMAGISRSEAEDAQRLCFALRQNNICQDGGKTHDLALNYVRALVSAPLLKKGGRRRGR